MLMKEHGKDKQAEMLMRGELTWLNLGDCQIGDGAVIVAAFIKDNDTVKEVYLWNSNIGPCGAKALADAVKHNKTVWRLDLGFNQIRQEGADYLVNSLNHNVCITELLIGANNIAHESRATIKYLTETRNAIIIPAAVRRVSVYLMAARRATPIADAGDLALFPKEIVKMIAMAVWATRKDPKWIEALSESERMGAVH